MNDSTEAGLALDDGVWHTHLSAERGKEDDELDGVDIIGNEDQRSLLGLNERHDVVETVLDCVRLLADILLLLALSNSRGLLVQTLLLLRLGLWAILVEQLEDLSGGVAVEGVRELGDGRWDFETHVQDLALALEADIFGPFHHAREVAVRLDVLADAEVAWLAFEEWVLPSSAYTCSKDRGMEEAHLVLSLLARATRLAGWEWRRSGSLARFWRLSLRRTVSHCSISTESAHSTEASVAAQAISSPASPQSAWWDIGHCCSMLVVVTTDEAEACN